MNSIVDHEESHRSASPHSNSPDTTAKAGNAAFKSEWHDAKEIVVPFDDNSFSGLLVSEKEFAAAYAPKKARPPMESLRLETGRTVGRIVDAPGFVQRVGGVTSRFLSVFEKLMMAWTPVLLLTAIPLPGWWSMILTGVWIAMLWVFYRFGSRLSVSLLVWMSGILATSAWLYHTPLMISFLRV